MTILQDITPAGGAGAWRGPDIDYRVAGMHMLDAEELAEIDAALTHLHSLGDIDLDAITPDLFPLTRCRAFLDRALHELWDGVGFLLVRGLQRERYSADDMARIYCGLGSYLGARMPQSYLGELLGNVIDVSDVEAEARGYHAGGGQRFHSDSCDIIGLMCLRAARSGGLSRIASGLAVHDAMLERRPDLLAELYGTYIFRRMPLDARHGDGVAVRPMSIFARDRGRVSSYVSGNYPLMAVKAGDSILSASQLEALDEIQRLAASPEFYLDMSIGEGDIQFLNNRIILHGRTDYEDWPEVSRRRHLLRQWLLVPGWPAQTERQGVHKAGDHAGWLAQRRPQMELPSRYLAEMTKRKAEMAA